MEAQRTLVVRCLKQMQAERAELVRLLAVVEQIRSALLSRDIGALETTLQSQRLEPSAEHLDERRSINRLLADQCGIEVSQVRLQTLVDFLKRNSEESVEPLYREVLRLRTDIENTSQGNMVIASSLSQMIGRFMHRAYGSPSTTTYGRDGTMNQQNTGGLIERRA